MRCDFSDEAALLRWMRREGDALLRTCYLLCGDRREARDVARQAFAQAWAKRSPSLWTDEHAARLVLLREAMRLCPCRKAHLLPFARRGIVPRLRRLPPDARRAALLCLHHGLSASDAADVLGREEALVLRDLRRARELLNL